MRVAFHTFGCKLNQYETESLASAFSNIKSTITAKDRADLHIINTCTVTSKSEQKARRLIRHISVSNPDSLVLVTGCYAQVSGNALADLGHNVAVVSQSDKSIIHDFAEFLNHPENALRFRKQDKRLTFLYFRSAHHDLTGAPFRYDIEDYTFHSRAFIKIQDGCSNNCSFCRVPQARGPAVSRDPGAILASISKLEKNGYGEVVLTGVNITSYSKEGVDFPALLRSIIMATSSIRIRLSSLAPEMIGSSLGRIIKEHRICPHFHIPVQSGSDRILTAMRRRYNRDKVYKAVTVLRDSQPEAFIAGDFIVGFPEESDQDFEKTIRTVNDLGLTELHVFPFSPRPDTDAIRMTQLPDFVKKERSSRLRILSEQLLERYRRSWEGREVTVVVESNTRDGDVKGISGNYLRLSISGVPHNKVTPGILVKCRIEKSDDPFRELKANFIKIGPQSL